MQLISTRDAGFEAAFTAILEDGRDTTTRVDAAVAEIIQSIRSEGDTALLRLTARFDGWAPADPTALRVTPAEVDAAIASVEPTLLEALDLAAQRIEAFHRAQLPADLVLPGADGVALGLRWNALDAVGLYVPGGKAAYPSSVLMNAIPARVAGVARLAMVVPTPGGALNPLVLAAARRAGVTEVWRIGGAQAVAALAWGTASIAPVDRVVGPGNAYVAEAKRQVFGRVGIDSIAGPSEVLILADGTNNPAHVAMDLMAQAEHDEAAQSILITDDAGFAQAVAREVEKALETLPRRAIAGESWARHGAIILVQNWEEAANLTNRLAPEHLQIMTADPQALFARIRHAGAAFLGRYTPEAIGDYVAGPNHVLPTGRTSRFASGLSVYDFLKRTTWVEANAVGLAAIGPAAVKLAEAEGLGAHAASVAIRL
ncbi:histidinol dehydrogenase [Roseococcus sp. SDR]|uniref:histidinol dehydrogenase n=1 Tax=Roseococcus sp. SDR TaxID=2835532 RepID=UPI001BCDF583|nr:histidinol dehydrogenase [Roseococcus sp. SDR]MBS7790515.1 histidinol dehydrogenase [Roseococcus sp. SDR]MBV1845829.1 histidinol dehydrogenase [Roseococcus sp. SDR]